MKPLSNYKENDEEKVMYDRAVKNFIKLVTKDRFNITLRLNNYNVLLAFLKKFDSIFKLFDKEHYKNREKVYKRYVFH